MGSLRSLWPAFFNPSGHRVPEDFTHAELGYAAQTPFLCNPRRHSYFRVLQHLSRRLCYFPRILLFVHSVLFAKEFWKRTVFLWSCCSASYLSFQHFVATHFSCTVSFANPQVTNAATSLSGIPAIEDYIQYSVFSAVFL